MKLYSAILLVFVCVACTSQKTTVGSEYVGKPYLNNPLGENIAPDTDPLIRFDAFDCLTFIETSLADGDVQKLKKIRYKNGIVDFVNRNHFIETDWIPNNSDLVQEVTEKYGKTAIRMVKIDRANWMKQHYDITDDTPVKTVGLKYIPYNTITKIENSEPLIVLFIRNTPKNIATLGTDLAVRHIGFLLPDGTLRHASRTKKSVVDTDFYKYINRIMDNKNNLGIMLLEIKK